VKNAHVLYHMVKADLLERVRRYGYLLTLLFTLFMAYGVYTGQLAYQFEGHRGVYNSAWLGCEMALVTTVFLTLFGFYVVKNTIQRDRETRVGQILASTPMSKSFYTVAKALSNFAVLTTMILVLALAALAMQLLHAENRHIYLWLLLSPIMAFGLTALAVTAALAVLFETLPGLRSGLGNVVYFFIWISLLIAGARPLDQNRPVTTGRYFADFSGIVSISSQMQAIVRHLDPQYNGGVALGVAFNADRLSAKRFLWTGLAWNPAMVLSRLMWLMIAAAIALLASLFFDRFDPARGWQFAMRKTKAQSPIENFEAAVNLPEQVVLPAHLTPLVHTSSGHKLRFIHLVRSELRLMLKGLRWWYLVAAGLLIAEFVAPLAAAHGSVLVAAWIWPILIWSQMGSRENRYATRSLIFSSPHALYRQLPAVWTAGIVVALATGSGVGIRLLLTGNLHAFAGWLVAAAFIPSLAIACGVWSGNSKLFEAIYTVWWYIGPLNHLPALDFMGTTPASDHTPVYLFLTMGLLAASLFGRRVRLAYA